MPFIQFSNVREHEWGDENVRVLFSAACEGIEVKIDVVIRAQQLESFASLLKAFPLHTPEVCLDSEHDDQTLHLRVIKRKPTGQSMIEVKTFCGRSVYSDKTRFYLDCNAAELDRLNEQILNLLEKRIEVARVEWLGL